jgi:hypothetical protein
MGVNREEEGDRGFECPDGGAVADDDGVGDFLFVNLQD